MNNQKPNQIFQSISMYFIGCCISISTTSTLFSQTSIPSTQVGFLYGTFDISEGYKDTGIFLVLLEEDTKREISIQLKKGKGNLCVVEVPPGNYKAYDVKQLITMMDDTPDEDRASVESMIQKVKVGITVKSNEAIYLGDFTGFNNLVYGGSKIAIISVANNCKATTGKVFTQYPKLKGGGWHFECR